MNAKFTLTPQKTFNAVLKDCSVLVCEANYNTKQTIVTFLNNLKTSNIYQCTNIREARGLLKKHSNIDIILCDFNISDTTTGIDFCKDVKRETPPFKHMFVLLANQSNTSDIVLAYREGVDGFLLKPFDFETFQDKIVQLYKEKQSPSKLKILLNQGFQQLENNELEEAEKNFKVCLELESNSAKARVGLGRIYELRNDHENALKTFTEAVSINPSFVEGHSEILRYHKTNGNLPLAIRWAENLAMQFPDNIYYLMALGDLYFENNDFENSILTYDKTLSINASAKAHKGKADSYYRLSNYDEAITSYQSALKLDPNSIKILNALGLAYSRKKEYHLALQQYRIAISIEPLNEKIYFNMGTAYESLKQWKEAEFCFQKALDIKPVYPKAIEALRKVKRY